VTFHTKVKDVCSANQLWLFVSPCHKLFL
jgi:hypothetical protein